MVAVVVVDFIIGFLARSGGGENGGAPLRQWPDISQKALSPFAFR
jgi:hypothetical protein